LSENFDEILKRHTKFAEESRVRINKLIAERDPNRTERYAIKKNKLLYSLSLIDYRLSSLKAELNKLYNERAGLVGQVQKLEKDYANGEPTI
jgi:hypothetical protein